MLSALETIQTFVAPVVVISANGLLCLAFYNRLSALANRSRTIHKEQFDLAIRLSTCEPDSAEAAHLKRRTATLDQVGHQLFSRADMVRNTVVYLLIAVLCMLACSLALGLSALTVLLAPVALTLFVAGILVMMLGIVTAIRELLVTLDPLLFEHEQMEEFVE